MAQLCRSPGHPVVYTIFKPDQARTAHLARFLTALPPPLLQVPLGSHYFPLPEILPAEPATLCTPRLGLWSWALTWSGAPSRGVPGSSPTSPHQPFLFAAPHAPPRPLLSPSLQTPWVFSRSPLSCVRVRRPRPPRPYLPSKTGAGQWAGRLAQPSHRTGSLLGGGGGREGSGPPRAPGALRSARQPHGGAESLEQPRAGTRHQSAGAAASSPRAPPELTPTPEHRSPGRPWSPASPARRAGLERPRTLFSRPPLRRGARGAPEAPPASPPSPFPSRPPAPHGAALRSDSGREAPRGVPGVLSPAPRSGDAREAGEGAQLVRRRASRHHALAAAAPRRGPRLAAAGECPARRAPRALGTRFGGKTASVADSETETGVAWDLGAGSARIAGSLGLL